MYVQSSYIINFFSADALTKDNTDTYYIVEGNKRGTQTNLTSYLQEK